MIQKEVPKISENLFIRAFTLAIIKSLGCMKFPPKGKICIDSELVPKISKSIVYASMGQKIIPPREIKNIPSKNSMILSPSNLVPQTKKSPFRQVLSKAIYLKPVPPRQNFSPSPILPKLTFHHQEPINPPNVPPKIVEAWQNSPVQISSSILDSPELSKIRQLLRDPSVFSVECLGKNKPLRVIMAGQKQMTRISLNNVEISDLLKKFSSESHIPLFDGVFKVAIENLLLNAIISGIIGSKFIIKKQIY
jgi:hypothetical protein